MKNKILFVLILVIPLLSYQRVFAGDICSTDGYSLLTINGINTDEKGARENKDNLKKKLKITTYKNQPLIVDFLHNKSHGQIFDALDTTNQIYFDENSLNIQDSDFAQMLTDASAKLNTQKVLLVSHSQGNFYANTFYDAVADEEGGVPSMSIGVYGVASPSSRVAGGGLYLTSDTDGMIIGTVAKFPFTNILKPNTHINFKAEEDALGHSFSKVYLAYEGNRIIADIKTSLNKLQNNNLQKENTTCIAPPKLTLTQKIQGTVLAVVDPVSIPLQASIVYVSVGSYHIATAIGNGVLNGIDTLASGISSLAQSIFNNTRSLALNNTASVIAATNDTNSALPAAGVARAEAGPVGTSISSAQRTVNLGTGLPAAEVGSEAGSGGTLPEVIAPIAEVEIPPAEPTSTSEIVTEGIGSTDVNIGTGMVNPVPVVAPVTILRSHHHSTPDTTLPVISLIGADIITINVGDTYTDSGATALDNIDGDITTNITVVNEVNVNTVADYTITYDVKDVAGNSALQVTRLVHVVDTAIPLITMLGNNPENINVGSIYTDAGATALDNVDGDITANIITINPVDKDVAGVYTVTYNVSDAKGNAATEAKRTVNVTAPLSTKEITAFSFENSLNTTINENVKTITVTMPSGTDLTALTPNITQTGISIYPENHAENNFTDPITYIVKAEDLSKKNYVVIVEIEPNISADYLNNTPGKLTGGYYLNFSPTYLETSQYQYGRVWYKGQYPDTSSPFSASNFPSRLDGQTLSCGQICTGEFSHRIPTYYWVGIYADDTNTRLVHFTEVFDTAVGSDGIRFNISNQGNVSNGSCSDGIKNQDETEVDTGGICTMKTLQRDYTCVGDCDYLDVVGKTKKGSVLYFSPSLYSADFGRVWYSGRYPDISNTVSGNNYPSNIDLQTLPCGHLCNVRIPQYFWIGIYPNGNSTDLAHYTEVYFSGKSTDQWNSYYITKQSE